LQLPEIADGMAGNKEGLVEIPDGVRIGGIDFTVTRKPRLLSDSDTLLCGQINHRTSEIFINGDLGEEMQYITLLHEVLHGVAEHAQLKLSDQEETIIDVFARGIYQVTHDNPEIFCTR
jgi:hypothetical protein